MTPGDNGVYLIRNANWPETQLNMIYATLFRLSGSDYANINWFDYAPNFAPIIGPSNHVYGISNVSQWKEGSDVYTYLMINYGPNQNSANFYKVLESVNNGDFDCIWDVPPGLLSPQTGDPGDDAFEVSTGGFVAGRPHLVGEEMKHYLWIGNKVTQDSIYHDTADDEFIDNRVDSLTTTSLTPRSLHLYPCTPNPFNLTTTLRYQLPAAGRVHLTVYDVSGRLVMTLVDAQLEAGDYEISVDGSNLSSGQYFLQLQAGDQTAVQTMSLLK